MKNDELVEVASVSEWVDAETADASELASTMPQPDEDYCYAAMRLFSWWPYVNSRGATYEREDFSEDLLGTLIGKQVNLEHDKFNKVIGSITNYSVHPSGVDIVARLDREQAIHHGLDIEDMRRGNYFSHCSLELTKDPEGSHFYAYDDGYNIKKQYPVITGRRMGIRRTTQNDPYALQGLKVAERIKPARFTGVGLVPVPADKTSTLYAVKANEGDDPELPKTMQEDLFIELLTEDYDLLVGENFEEAAATKALTPGSNYADPGYKGVKKYPLDSEGHVRSASRFWGISSYRAGYTSSQQAHISAAIARAKKKYGIGDGAEKASEGATTLSATDLATLEAKVAELVAQVATLTSAKETAAAESNTRIAQLEAEVLSLKTELASAVEKVSVYEKEKASAEKSAKAEAFLNELHEIHPLTDEDRAGLKEKAFEACDDEGIRQTLVHKQRDAAYDARQAVLAEREAALKAREDALPAAAAPAAAAVVAPAKKDKEGEVASEEDDARTLIVPPVTLSFQGKEVTYTPGKYV